jgi:uncharacterized protein (TIGR03435 family)
LKVHRETKEGAACALTVAKSGAKLSPAATLKEGERARVSSGRTGSPTAAAITYWHQGHHASTAMLAATLTTLFSRPVLDQTGLKGDYDFKVEYGADDTQPGDFPSLFTALQEQLGLKLEPAKAPVETLVVDRAEKPSGN